MRSEGSPSTGKKRVRFSDTPPQLLEYREAQELDYSSKKRRGEGGGQAALDPMEALEGQITAVCLYEGGASLDPASAAAQRARQRKDNLMARFEEGNSTFLGSIEAVEAGYEEPEERFNDAGIPIEPFHLKREREEGYFDEAGTYVEYRTDDIEDSWVDSLADVEVDEGWLARVRAAQAAAGVGQGGGGDEEGEDLDPDSLRAYKQRLADLLLPGETTLEALRRLGRHRVGRPGAEGGEGGESGPAAGHARPKQVMPSPVRELFERLTEYSSLLMEHGEYGIHSQSREAILRSLQLQQAQHAQQGTQEAGQREGVREGEVVSAARGGGGQNMMPGAVAAAGEGVVEDRDAGVALAQRLLAGAGGREDGGGEGGLARMSTDGEAPPVPPAAAQGAAEGVGLGDAARLAGQAPPLGGGEEVDIFAGEDENGGPGAAGAAGGAPAAEGPSAGAGTGSLLGGSAGPGQGPREEAGAAGGGSGAGSVREDDGGQQQQQPQQGSVGARGDEEMTSMDAELPAEHALPAVPGEGGAAALPAWPQGAEGEEEAGEGARSLEGFELDPASGYWFNSSLGCYYDATRQLYGDAQSGRWFKWVDGQYQPA